MNFKAYTQRFDNLLNTHKKGAGFFMKLYYVIDWIFAYIFHGASFNDYFVYEFDKLRPSGRNEFITFKKYKYIQKVLNDKNDISICRDKSLFYDRFNDMLGREFIDVNRIGFQEFRDFMESKNEVFVKEVLGFRGTATVKYKTAETGIPQLWQKLKNDTNGHYLIEECISQHHELAEFHPWSVNTIRILTVYDKRHDKVNIMNAQFRMGNFKNSVDNFHFGGIGARINVGNGIIDTVGYDVNDDSYAFHPLTGKQIVGTKIPYWDECKTYIENAARRIPTVGYIGWDLVIKENGEMCLVEANDNADHDIQQLHNRPMWRDYKEILDNL